MISFNVTKQQHQTIVRIIARAEDKGWLKPSERMGNVMDLSACIAQGCDLDLEAMEREIDGKHSVSVSHDIGGIRRHIDRNDESPTAGQLLDCFLPRFTKKADAAAAA